MIDPEGIIERFRNEQTRGRLINFMELIRNTLILAPIMITWFGISQATQQYDVLLSQYLHDNSHNVDQPFLYLWQEGFGGRLPPFLTLSSIALFDAGLLFLILVLTFFTFYLDQQNTAHSERETLQLRGELMHALTGASLLLVGKRKPEPLTAGDNLEVVAQKYDKMTRETNARFEGMVQQVLAQFNAMTRQVLDQFTDTTKKITTQFADVSRKMDTQLQAGNTYLTTLNTFVNGFQVLSQGMQSAAQNLKDTNNSLTTSINGLVVPAKEMAEQQKKPSESVKDSAVLLQSSAKSLSEFGRKQDVLAQDMRDTLDNIIMAVQKATQLASSVGNFTVQQGQFLKQLELERDAQRQLATLMSSASTEVKDALDAIKVSGTSMRAIAHDMKDIVDLQRASDNSSVVQTYTNAAHVIEKSGHSLSASAMAIYDASQKLADVVDELKSRLATIK
ncbi:MAG: hypothetical protein NVS4B7_18430 [Ktedonobacteraceae bacterium]